MGGRDLEGPGIEGFRIKHLLPMAVTDMGHTGGILCVRVCVWVLNSVQVWGGLGKGSFNLASEVVEVTFVSRDEERILRIL